MRCAVSAAFNRLDATLTDREQEIVALEGRTCGDVSWGRPALAALSSSAQEVSTVSSLVESAESYDGEVVRVAGVVADYRERVSAAGVSYTFFRLRDGRASVAVFAWPHLGLRDGQRVRVTGLFFKVKTYPGFPI